MKRRQENMSYGRIKNSLFTEFSSSSSHSAPKFFHLFVVKNIKQFHDSRDDDDENRAIFSWSWKWEKGKGTDSDDHDDESESPWKCDENLQQVLVKFSRNSIPTCVYIYVEERNSSLARTRKCVSLIMLYPVNFAFDSFLDSFFSPSPLRFFLLFRLPLNELNGKQKKKRHD